MDKKEFYLRKLIKEETKKIITEGFMDKMRTAKSSLGLGAGKSHFYNSYMKLKNKIDKYKSNKYMNSDYIFAIMIEKISKFRKKLKDSGQKWNDELYDILDKLYWELVKEFQKKFKVTSYSDFIHTQKSDSDIGRAIKKLDGIQDIEKMIDSDENSLSGLNEKNNYIKKLIKEETQKIIKEMSYKDWTGVYKFYKK